MRSSTIVELLNSAAGQCHQALRFFPSWLSWDIPFFSSGLTSRVAHSVTAAVPGWHPDMRMSKVEEASRVCFLLEQCGSWFQKPHSSQEQTCVIEARCVSHSQPWIDQDGEEREGGQDKAHDSVQLISFFPWEGGGRLFSLRVISRTKLVFSLHGERGRNRGLIDNNVWNMRNKWCQKSQRYYRSK